MTAVKVSVEEKVDEKKEKKGKKGEDELEIEAAVVSEEKKLTDIPGIGPGIAAKL